jgi:hypothetical protein
MSAESFVDASNDGKRKARRARVLLSVRLRTSAGEVEGRLRDLSRKGALVECGIVPPAGSEVLFTRGSTSVPARVAWTGGNRVGLEFAFMIDENEVLVQLGPSSQDSPNQSRFRRPRLFGEEMSEQERQVARDWAKTVGINITGA